MKLFVPTARETPAARTRAARDAGQGARRRPARALLAALMLGAAPGCGRDASPEPSAPPADLPPGGWTGYALAALDDRDGDGVPDVVVGAPGDSPGGRLAGAFLVLSGRDGAVLARHDGARAWSVFGSSVATLPRSAFGDTASADAASPSPGDGTVIAVGAPKDASLGLAAGSVTVFAGADLARRWQRGGERPGDHLGDALAACGDLDGDGVVDLAVGAPAHDTAREGALFVLSGADGRTLLRVPGGHPDDRFGRSVAGVGDVDGDGVPDLLAGAPDDDGAASSAGRAALHSGADGRMLLQWTGRNAFDALGAAVASPGDLDGDGVPDALLGVPSDDASHPGAGAVLAVSGGDGRVLWHAVGAAPREDFGASLGALPDVDGDGVPDAWAGAVHAAAGRGAVRILSGADGRTLAELTGDAPGTAFGFAAAWRPAGAHTLPALLVGAYLADDARGAVLERPLPAR